MLYNGVVMAVLPGFEIIDSPYYPAIGIASLRVHLGAQPQERGFDSARLRLPIIEHQEIQEVEVMHPWVNLAGRSPLCLAAGRFTLYDHADHALYGFSLGGQVEVKDQEDLTSCCLSSSAPLLLLQDDPESPDRVLADELEALFARRRAAWGLDEAMFVSRMQAADPMKLLAACLGTLDARLKRITSLDHGRQYQDLEQHIHHLQEVLQNDGSWPSIVPRIEDLI